MGHDPKDPAAKSEVGAATTDAISQLERLAVLKERGHITEGEFAAQKVRLLGPKAEASSVQSEVTCAHIPDGQPAELEARPGEPPAITPAGPAKPATHRKSSTVSWISAVVLILALGALGGYAAWQGGLFGRQAQRFDSSNPAAICASADTLGELKNLYLAQIRYDGLSEPDTEKYKALLSSATFSFSDIIMTSYDTDTKVVSCSASANVNWPMAAFDRYPISKIDPIDNMSVSYTIIPLADQTGFRYTSDLAADLGDIDGDLHAIAELDTEKYTTSSTDAPFWCNTGRAGTCAGPEWVQMRKILEENGVAPCDIPKIMGDSFATGLRSDCPGQENIDPSILVCPPPPASLGGLKCQRVNPDGTVTIEDPAAASANTQRSSTQDGDPVANSSQPTQALTQ